MKTKAKVIKSRGCPALCVDEYEAAEMLRIGIATFQREVKDGRIPRTKVRGTTRYSIDALKAYLARHTAEVRETNGFGAEHETETASA
jgi:excisionase family DNA binding protein